jgi:hypothetical protein
MNKLILLTALFTATSFSASFGTSIGFPSAPTSPGCTRNRTDRTSACYASNNTSDGSSMISFWRPDTTSMIVFGSLSTTQPSGSSVTVKAYYTANITEFAGLTSGGVTVSSDYTDDTEPIQVLDNTGSIVAILEGGDSINIPYNKASTIILGANHMTAGPEDYASDFHITMSRY